MCECGGHVTVTGGMKIIEKTGQEPEILSGFAFVVRRKNQKSIYQKGDANVWMEDVDSDKKTTKNKVI